MRISDWSSDVCSSDLPSTRHNGTLAEASTEQMTDKATQIATLLAPTIQSLGLELLGAEYLPAPGSAVLRLYIDRSEEHTSELQSLMRMSYAVFCLQKKQLRQHTLYLNRHVSNTSIHPIDIQ